MLDNFIIRDIKESICEVAADAAGLADAKANAPEEEYDTASNGNDMLPGFESKKFPDTLTVGTERFEVAEALFNPNAYLGRDLMVPGIQKMVQQTIAAVAIDLVAPLYSNVVLAGGTTMLPGFGERLKHDLSQGASVPVTVATPQQRHVAAWAGASVLAMAKHFNFHWVSKEEYEQYGLDLAHHP